MSLDITPARPGADPARPHCDLRLPPLSQASRAVGAPSWTAEAALLIASLHRAAEVAFFTWRAQQPDGGVAPPPAPSAQPEPDAASRTAVSSLQAAQALDAAAVRRRAISAALQHDLATAMPLRDAATSRSTGVGIIHLSDDDAETRSTFQLPPGLASDWLSHLIAEADDDESDEGDDADESVVRAAMGGASESTRERNTTRGSSTRHDVVDAAFRALSGLSTGESEHDVWQRMIRDLALPSSYPPAPLARMASARARELTIPRQLPHPVWARRYPGAAGDWLRAELSRRAAGHRERTQTGPRRVNQHSESRAHRAPDNEVRSAVEFLQETTLPLDERGAVTIRTTTVGNVLRARAQASAPATRVTRGPNYTSSSRPARRSIESMTASLGLDRFEQRRGADQVTSSPPTSDRTEEIARLERSAAAAARVADLVQQQRVRRGQALSEARAGVASARSEAPARSRAVRGGLDFLARLRELDGSSSSASAPAEDRAQSAVYANARPVFPWYSGSAHEEPPVASSSSWFEAARERQDAQAGEERRAAEAREAARQRYGFMPPDDVDEPAPFPRLRTEESQSNHAQRQRNRIATVVAERDSEVPSMRLAAEGWTLIDPAANTVPSAADEAASSRDDGRWLFDGPAQPSRRFSASPMALEPTLSPPPIISAAQWAAEHNGARTASLDDPRALRRPRRLASLTTEDVTAAARSSASSPITASPTAGSPFGLDRAGPGVFPALRRAEYHGAGTPRQAVSSPPPSADAFLRLNAADAWANSEAERDFQSRLDGSDVRQPAAAGAATPSSLRIERASQAVSSASDEDRDMQQLRDLSSRFNREMAERREELREAETRLRIAVAQRRQELDQLRFRQGRIGRVVESPAVASQQALQHGSTEEGAFAPGSSPEQRVASGTTPAASTLVQRRASRDANPVLRPYHRHERREAAAHAASESSLTAPDAEAEHLIPSVRHASMTAQSSPTLAVETAPEADDKETSAVDEQRDVEGFGSSSAPSRAAPSLVVEQS
ncbi:hypothetical protein FA09DRAFT_340219 [Tilletiopsis washingtonensis]|uniref:Uncharacterized protein n=1 Tax=Tilletiopsis washingtonensis TaxID=58919 RepID=A0A316Z8C7_9BASI|nr:hypothetical protein FA09DRAFT_340219 [Tilletiopsis washingtonensis]PWN96423.1 hypothetical protein FA09DRAFT_340219 [Tilletiopsis washingtonensis]